jgi:hypothetical protein
VLLDREFTAQPAGGLWETYYAGRLAGEFAEQE